MTKLTITITQTFEVDYICYPRLSAGFEPDPTDPDDWEISLDDEVICLETGCAVLDDIILLNDTALKQIIHDYYSNYEPPGL